MSTLDDEATKLLINFKALVEKSETQSTLLQKEINKLVPRQEPADSEDDKNLSVSRALAGMKLSQVTKLSRFNKGVNFSRYCERFQEFVTITKMRDENLPLYFLQHVDDETYSALKAVNLTPTEKRERTLL